MSPETIDVLLRVLGTILVLIGQFLNQRQTTTVEDKSLPADKNVNSSPPSSVGGKVASIAPIPAGLLTMLWV